MQTHFWSIRFQTDRKLTFGPVGTNEGGSKVMVVFEQIDSRDHLFRREIGMDQK